MVFFKGIIKTFEKFSRIEELAKGYRCISVETFASKFKLVVLLKFNPEHLLHSPSIKYNGMSAVLMCSR